MSNYEEYMSQPENERRVYVREALIFSGVGAALGFLAAKKLKVNPLLGIAIGIPTFYYGLYALHNGAWKKR